MEISKSMAIFHECWRLANQGEEPKVLQCATVAAAARMRFAMYNAVKPYRSGKREADPELAEAILNCSISLTPDKTGVIMGRKLDTEMSRMLLEAVGGKLPLTVDERMANSAYERIMKRGQVEPGDVETTTGPDGKEIYTKGFDYGARPTRKR